MKWYDEIIVKSMYCDGCGNKPESRIMGNVMAITLQLWCLSACKGPWLMAALQFLTAGNILILVRQLIIYHRRGST